MKIVKFKNLIKEEIYGNYATVYHRTSISDLINKVYTSGFKVGNGDMYGKGFYSTYSIKSQIETNMTETYGDYIVKFAVTINDFLICDYNQFIKSPWKNKLKDYNEKNFIDLQLDYKKIKHEKVKYNHKYSSEIAYWLYNQKYTTLFKGLIFTGSRDGQVLVCYYPNKLVIPLSYKQDSDDKFSSVKKNLPYLKKIWKDKDFKMADMEKLEIILEKLEIENYTINKDKSIDVHEDVDISERKLTKLPIKFNKIDGYFECSDNKLKSLKGCPKIVKGYFKCNYNKLKSLKGGPEIVEGDFSCYYNELISLEGAPKIIEGDFICFNNKLKSLKNAPEIIKGDFQCFHNELTSLEGIPKTIGGNLECYHNSVKFIEKDIGKVCKVKGKISV